MTHTTLYPSDLVAFNCSLDYNIYGKWMVFRSKYEDIESRNTLIHNIQECFPYVIAKDNIIFVYTSKDDIDNIGSKLIKIVKQKIIYKLQEHTDDQIYYKGKPFCRTLHYQNV